MAWLPYPDPRLADDGVVLRPWAEGDVRCVEDEKRCDVGEARLWISRQWRRQSEGAGVCLAIADAATDEALGCIGLLFRTRAGTAPVAGGREPDAAGLVFELDPGAVGVGYWVLERGRGRGLASRAVALLTDWALTQAGLARVEALVEPGNVASQRVLERAGFVREGRLRSYLIVAGGRVDTFLYARLPTS
jgi:ribosomal-protein-alanine N-acetyltransferase